MVPIDGAEKWDLSNGVTMMYLCRRKVRFEGKAQLTAESSRDGTHSELWIHLYASRVNWHARATIGRSGVILSADY